MKHRLKTVILLMTVLSMAFVFLFGNLTSEARNNKIDLETVTNLDEYKSTTFMNDTQRNGIFKDNLFSENIEDCIRNLYKYDDDTNKKGYDKRYTIYSDTLDGEIHSPFKNVSVFSHKKENFNNEGYVPNLPRTQPLANSESIIFLGDTHYPQDKVVCLSFDGILPGNREVSSKADNPQLIRWSITKVDMGFEFFSTKYSQPYLHKNKYILPCITKNNGRFSHNVLIIDVRDGTLLKNLILMTEGSPSQNWISTPIPVIINDIIYLGTGRHFYTINLQDIDFESDDLDETIYHAEIMGNGLCAIDEQNSTIYIVRNNETEGPQIFYYDINDSAKLEDILNDSKHSSEKKFKNMISWDALDNAAPQKISNLAIFKSHLFFCDYNSKLQRSTVFAYDVNRRTFEFEELIPFNGRHPSFMFDENIYTPFNSIDGKKDELTKFNLNSDKPIFEMFEIDNIGNNKIFGGTGSTFKDLVVIPSYELVSRFPTIQFMMFNKNTDKGQSKIILDFHLRGLNLQPFKTGAIITERYLFCQDSHGSLVCLESKKASSDTNWKNLENKDVDLLEEDLDNLLLEDIESKLYSISFDADGRPHVAWINDEKSICYASWDKYSKKWFNFDGQVSVGTNTKIITYDKMDVSEIDLLLDFNGNPHLVWVDKYREEKVHKRQVFYATGDSMMCKWFDGHGKELPENIFHYPSMILSLTKYENYNPSFDVDDKGRPHVAWESKNDDGKTDIKYVFLKDNDWHTTENKIYTTNNLKGSASSEDGANISRDGKSSKPNIKLKCGQSMNSPTSYISWVTTWDNENTRQIILVKHICDYYKAGWYNIENEKYTLSSEYAGKIEIIKSNASVGYKGLFQDNPTLQIGSKGAVFLVWEIDGDSDGLLDSIECIKIIDKKCFLTDGTELMKNDKSELMVNDEKSYIYKSPDKNNYTQISQTCFALDSDENPHFFWAQHFKDVPSSVVCYLLWDSNKSIFENGYYRSDEDSKTSEYFLWLTAKNAGESRQVNPKIAFCPSGNVHLSWIDLNKKSIKYMKGDRLIKRNISFKLPFKIELQLDKHEKSLDFDVHNLTPEVESPITAEVIWECIGGKQSHPRLLLEFDLGQISIPENTYIKNLTLYGKTKTTNPIDNDYLNYKTACFGDSRSQELTQTRTKKISGRPLELSMTSKRAGGKLYAYADIVQSVSKGNNSSRVTYLSEDWTLHSSLGSTVFESPYLFVVSPKNIPGNKHFDNFKKELQKYLNHKKKDGFDDEHIKLYNSMETLTDEIKTNHTDGKNKYRGKELYIFIIGDYRTIPGKARENELPGDWKQDETFDSDYGYFKTLNDKGFDVHIGRLPINFHNFDITGYNAFKDYVDLLDVYSKETMDRRGYSVIELDKIGKHHHINSLEFKSNIIHASKTRCTENDEFRSSIQDIFLKKNPLFVDLIATPFPSSQIDTVHGIGGFTPAHSKNNLRTFPWFLYSTSSYAAKPQFLANGKQPKHFLNELFTSKTNCLGFIGYTSDINKDRSINFLDFHSEFCLSLPSSKDKRFTYGNLFNISRDKYIKCRDTVTIDYLNKQNLFGDPSTPIKTHQNLHTQIHFLSMRVGENQYSYNNNAFNFEFDKHPKLINNTAYLPMREVVEKFGGVASWDSDLKKASFSLDGKSVSLQADGEKAINEGGTFILPIRYVSESLGCEVTWFGDNKDIVITYEKRNNHER